VSHHTGGGHERLFRASSEYNQVPLLAGFDRLLLNGCIQSFLDGAEPQAFSGFIEDLSGLSRNVLRDVANQYHNWAERSAQEWGVEIVDDPKGRRDDFETLL